jgi:hypothetical protein
VIAAAELARLLHGDDVSRILDHAHDRRISAGVGAEGAELRLGHVEAAGAQRGALLDLSDCSGEAECLLLVHLEQVEGDALSRLGSDAGESTQLVDQVLDGAGVHSAWWS